MPEKFSASQAGKFRNCHASANLDLAIPNWTPPVEDPAADNAANRGSRMHEVFAGVMGLKTSDMFQMTDAILYVAQFRNRRRYKVLVEVTEKADWLPSMPCTTADLVLYLSDELHIFDLKTGKIPVSPVRNDQLLYYAATYWKYAPKAKEVHLHIVQPWAAGAPAGEEWIVGDVELLKWMYDTIDHDVQILNGSRTFSPGDHCRFCDANPHSRGAKGRPFCPAMMQLLYPEPLIDEAAVFAAAEEE